MLHAQRARYVARMGVILVGGGFAGLTTAAALSSLGLDVTVIEASATARAGFRGELLHPRGTRELRKLSLDGALSSSKAVGVDGFAVYRDGDAKPVMLPFAGGEGVGFAHEELVAALRAEVASRSNVRILAPLRAEAPLVEQGKVVGVRTADGAVHRAELVVAADGRRSRMRASLGIEDRSELLSYSVIASLEGDVLPELRYGNVFLGGPGPILAYPYAPGRVRMCIDVPLGLATGETRLRAFIRDHHAPFLPEPIRTELVAALAREPFRACANHAIVLASYVRPGFVLVGDAGGCSHPLTATGMTIALHDAIELAEAVRRRGLTEEALALYQGRRNRFVRAREAFAQSLYDVFRGADQGTQALRLGVFRYWEGSERARRASMAILSGEVSGSASLVGELARVLGNTAADRIRTIVRERAFRRGTSGLLAATSSAGRCLRTMLGRGRPRGIWRLPRAARLGASRRARFHGWAH
jgi:2-polyprenyl-6-methoxyphenol hydroxylase-like FAD-dependent oxidoreductase